MAINLTTAARAIRNYGGVAGASQSDAQHSAAWRDMQRTLRAANAAATASGQSAVGSTLAAATANRTVTAGGAVAAAGNVPLPDETAPIVTLSSAALQAYANYIIYGSAWQGSSDVGDANNSLSLTYSYIDPSYNYYSQGSYSAGNPYSPFTPTQITSATTKATFADAINQWARVSNISFTQISESGSTVGNLRVGIDAANNTAYAYLPINGQGALSGDVLLGGNQPNSGQPLVRDWTTDLTPGSYNYLTMMHEIGHALGMRHPHDTGRDTKLFGTRLPAVGKAWDQLRYSVMSYRDSFGASVKTGYTIDFYPTTLMLNDIAAAQYLYGTDTTTNAGNNTYSFAAGQQFFQTLYDTGGTDTFDASAQTLATRIDLRGGRFSTVGEAIHWSSKGKAQSARDFVAIAYDSVIENAIGGSGNDVIYGNAADNTLTGNAGNDVFVVNPDALTSGHDTVVGGTGGDTLVLNDFGASSPWTASESGGVYTFTAANGYTVDATGVEYVAFGEKGIRTRIGDLPASFTAADVLAAANRAGTDPNYDYTRAVTINGKSATASGTGLFETADGAIYVAKGVKPATTDAKTGLIRGGIGVKSAVTSLVAADGSLYELGAGDDLKAFTRTKTGEVTLYVQHSGAMNVVDFDADGNQVGSTRTVAFESPAMVDIELKLRKDLNGDGITGANIVQQLAFGATSGFYQVRVGSTDFFAIGGAKLAAGKPLKASAITMTLKNGDGSAWTPPSGKNLASYAYTTSAKVISGATITLSDSSTVQFDANGYVI